MANTGGAYTWSQTQATNATADATVNWAEGQAPSSINDSARNMMASVAKWRDDIAGAITTGGTSTAYTVTSYQAFDTLANMSGKVIAFTPHTTNTGTTTLNVDSLGAKPLRSAPSVEIPSGTLIQGTPYLALYNNSDAVFYLHGFFGNPYNIPIGATLDYWLPTAPNSSFVFPYGQAVSRTTYATLFASMGTTYGTGDGTTTFNLPDLRGRVKACVDNMGGSAASRLSSTYFGTAATALGAAGGAESNTLTAAKIPSLTSNGSNSITVTAGSTSIPTIPSGFSINNQATAGGSSSTNNLPYLIGAIWGASGNLSGNNNITVTSTGTNGDPHANVQPTILCNCIMRII